MLISCLMELARYPLDQQICSLKMESYSHDYKELQLYVSLKTVKRFELIFQMMQGENNNPSVNGIFDLSLQQFVIQDARITNELDTQNGFTNQRITLNFRLERRIMYFVLQSYVPCTLITILR